MSTYVVVAVTASWKADTRSSGGAFSPPKPGNGKNKEHIVLLDTATLKQRKLSRLLYGVLGTSGDAIREGILMNGGLNVAQLTFSKPPPYDSVSSASRPIPLKFDNVLFERMQAPFAVNMPVVGLSFTRPTETTTTYKKTTPIPRALVVFDAVESVIDSTAKSSGGIRLKGRMCMRVDGKDVIEEMEFVIWSSSLMRCTLDMKVPLILVDASFKKADATYNESVYVNYETCCLQVSGESLWSQFGLKSEERYSVTMDASQLTILDAKNAKGTLVGSVTRQMFSADGKTVRGTFMRDNGEVYEVDIAFELLIALTGKDSAELAESLEVVLCSGIVVDAIEAVGNVIVGANGLKLEVKSSVDGGTSAKTTITPKKTTSDAMHSQTPASVLVEAQKQLFDVMEATGVAAGIGGSSTMSFEEKLNGLNAFELTALFEAANKKEGDKLTTNIDASKELALPTKGNTLAGESAKRIRPPVIISDTDDEELERGRSAKTTSAKKPKEDVVMKEDQPRRSSRGKKFVPEAVLDERWNDKEKRTEVQVKWEGLDDADWTGKDHFISQIGGNAFSKLMKNKRP